MKILPVSVVLVTWNSTAVVGAAMRALIASEPRPAQVVVVDNASTDGSVDIVAAIVGSVPDIVLTVRQEPSNTGFAAAANRGIEAATQPFVFLHNPDLVLMPDTLARLVTALAVAPPMTAAVGPKLLRATGDDLTPTDIIDSTGIQMTREGRHVDRGAGEPDRGQYDALTDVFGLTGAAVLFRREVLLAGRVDGEVFDEDFFAYREDADLAWRLRGFGYSAVLVPDAIAYHRRTVTPERRRRLSAGLNRHSVKNRFLLRIHHADRGWWAQFGMRRLVRDALVVGACLTVERSSFRGLVWVVHNLGHHRRRRHEILRRRTVTSTALRAWFQ